MRFRITILLLLTLSALTSSYAYPFSAIRKYDIADGISENTVRTIVQDRSGYIWLGTKDGISRFNGHTFQNYGGYPKTTDLGLLNVIKLCIHSDGRRIWVGTVDGLYIFDPISEKFTRLSSEPEIKSIVNDICYDNDGGLWIATSAGLFRYNETEDTLKRYGNTGEKGSLKGHVTLSLLKDSSGDIWIGTRNGLAFYHKGLDKFILHKWPGKQDNGVPYEINHLIENSRGEIWIGTHYDGLLCYDRITGQFSQHRVSLSEGGNTWIRALHETKEGDLHIGTEDGLFILDNETRKVRHAKDFSKSVIYSITQDHEGGTWVGTYFDGIYYIPPQSSNVTWFREIQGENSLSGKAVSQFCEDSNGNIWVATEDEGLNRFNKRTKKFIHYKTDTTPPQPENQSQQSARPHAGRQGSVDRNILQGN